MQPDPGMCSRGHQGLPVADVARLCQDVLLVAVLLLHPHQRGHRVPPRVPPHPLRSVRFPFLPTPLTSLAQRLSRPRTRSSSVRRVPRMLARRAPMGLTAPLAPEERTRTAGRRLPAVQVESSDPGSWPSPLSIRLRLNAIEQIRRYRTWCPRFISFLRGQHREGQSSSATRFFQVPRLSGVFTVPSDTEGYTRGRRERLKSGLVGYEMV
jgi:hypothetical protein